MYFKSKKSDNKSLYISSINSHGEQNSGVTVQNNRLPGVIVRRHVVRNLRLQKFHEKKIKNISLMIWTACDGLISVNF